MPGHTVIELLLVLTLIGATAASVAPSAGRHRDRAAVVAAREAAVGVFAEARLAAVEYGAALVRIRTAPAEAAVVVGDSVLRRVDLAQDFGVSVELGRGGERVELRYDALGLGRLASQRLELSRGRATSELIVSSYGRVRRR